MTDMPVYDPQTRSHQRKLLKRGHAGQFWLASYRIQGNRYGRQEMITSTRQQYRGGLRV